MVVSNSTRFRARRYIHPPECPTLSSECGSVRRLRDSFHEIYAPHEALVTAQLPPGSWVAVVPAQHQQLSDSANNRAVAARICVLDARCPAVQLTLVEPDSSEDIMMTFSRAYMSAQMASELGIIPGTYAHGLVDVAPLKQWCSVVRPLVASKVTLCQISAATHRRNQLHCDTQLAQYFAVPRVLRAGETFSVYPAVCTLSHILASEHLRSLVFQNAGIRTNEEERCSCSTIPPTLLADLASLGLLWRPLWSFELGLEQYTGSSKPCSPLSCTVRHWNNAAAGTVTADSSSINMSKTGYAHGPYVEIGAWRAIPDPVSGLTTLNVPHFRVEQLCSSDGAASTHPMIVSFPVTSVFLSSQNVAHGRSFIPYQPYHTLRTVPYLPPLGAAEWVQRLSLTDTMTIPRPGQDGTI